MWLSIAFLRSTGVYITSEMAKHLYMVARAMVLQGVSSQRISNSSYEGKLVDTGERACLGFFSGRKFSLDVDHDGGSGTSVFILDDRPGIMDLELEITDLHVVAMPHPREVANAVFN